MNTEETASLIAIVIFLNHLCDNKTFPVGSTVFGTILNHLCDDEHLPTKYLINCFILNHLYDDEH